MEERRSLRFRFIVCGRNHAAYTEQCLSSLLAQRGSDFTVDWTDDASDDDSALWIAQRMLREKELRHVGMLQRREHHVERRPERRGGMANVWHAIRRAQDDGVCVIVGGDDWIEPRALERLSKEFADPDCWLAYGTYKNSDGTPGVSAPWRGSDPRAIDFVWAPIAFRAWLAKKVAVEDLQLGGFFVPSSADVALTIPMVEMAGPKRCRYIEDVWYTRRLHNVNDHSVDGRLQSFVVWSACAKPRYSQLETSSSVPTRTPHRLGWSMLFHPDLERGAPVSTDGSGMPKLAYGDEGPG